MAHPVLRRRGIAAIAIGRRRAGGGGGEGAHRRTPRLVPGPPRTLTELDRAVPVAEEEVGHQLTLVLGHLDSATAIDLSAPFRVLERLSELADLDQAEHHHVE